jgi:hypothetical protein
MQDEADKIEMKYSNRKTAKDLAIQPPNSEEEKALDAKKAAKKIEQVQTDLKEISARHEQDNTLSAQAAYEGRQAREALKELELARTARETIGGEPGLKEALRHRARAQEIEDRIPSLKDSEKTNPIDSSQIIRDLAGTVASIDRNTHAMWNY